MEVAGEGTAVNPTGPNSVSNKYTAILVKNSGANYMDWYSDFANIDQIELLFQLGYQLIDFEPLDSMQQDFALPDDVGYCVMVQTNGAWFSDIADSPTIYVRESNAYLRLIDLNRVNETEFAAIFANQ